MCSPATHIGNPMDALRPRHIMHWDNNFSHVNHGYGDQKGLRDKRNKDNGRSAKKSAKTRGEGSKFGGTIDI